MSMNLSNSMGGTPPCNQQSCESNENQLKPENGNAVSDAPTDAENRLKFGAIGHHYPDMTHDQHLQLQRMHRAFAESLNLTPNRAHDLFEAMVDSEKQYTDIEASAVDGGEWKARAFNRRETDKLTDVYSRSELQPLLERAREFLNSSPEGRELLERGAFQTSKSIGRLLMYMKRKHRMDGEE